MKTLIILLLLVAFGSPSLPTGNDELSRRPLAVQSEQAETEQKKEKERLVIIVNKANPIESLTLDEVRRLFLRKELTWANSLKGLKDLKGFDVKTRIQPVENARKKENVTFLKRVIRKDVSALERYWIKLQYQSAIRRPTRVSTSRRVIRYVASLPGGLGFVNESALTESAKKHVKVIATLELMP